MKIKIPGMMLLVLLAGCASSPKLDYHTIDLTPSGGADNRAKLVVDRFQVSEKLDRHQIVVQATPTRIEYYATDRWASSVAEMVEAKLGAEFGPPGDDRPKLKVAGKVTAFEQVDGDTGPQARVRLEVTIRHGDEKRYEEPLLVKTYESTRSAQDNGVDGVVQALSRAIEEIAAEITADAAKL